MRSIGTGIGKRRCVACVMDARGSVPEESSYDNTYGDAREFAARVRRRYGRCQAACESTGNMRTRTFRAFEGRGIPITLANTLKMRIISDTSAKTDPIDARKIADTLRAGMIPACYAAPAEIRDAGELMRYRIRMVQDRTAVINQMRSLPGKYDVKIDASGMHSKKALRLPGKTTLGMPNDDLMPAGCTERIAHVTDRIGQTGEEIDRQAGRSDEAMLLMSMTGIDAFAAMLLLAEIGDISRFAAPTRLVSWAGMCPRVYQSGDREYHGRIKKDANRRADRVMIRAANTAVRHDERMRAFYERVLGRCGRRHAVAVTHVADKMIRIIRRMLTAGTPYSSRNEALYGRKIRRVAGPAKAARGGSPPAPPPAQ